MVRSRIVVFLMIMFAGGCPATERNQQTHGIMRNRSPDKKIPSREDVVRIAQSDASRVYRDLSIYDIRVAMHEDGWHVDFVLKDSRLDGGGAHYLIDKQSGEIVRKRYEQ